MINGYHYERYDELSIFLLRCFELKVMTSDSMVVLIPNSARAKPLGQEHLLSREFCVGKIGVLLQSTEGFVTETIFADGFGELIEWSSRCDGAGFCYKWVRKIGVDSLETCVTTFLL
jgi:hypothetical protein